jgi:thioester reductase-like protein
MEKEKKRTIFLTGATGLVGSYLLKILLQNNHKVFVLARSKADKSAKQRVVEVLDFWDKEIYQKHSRNLVVIDGDITKEKLGLNEKDLALLKNEVEEIFHCAAITEFNWPIEAISKINVEGTKNVFDVALYCKRLKKINHISTAYVCGDHKGIFREDDLDVGQGFNTTYEESKYQAEKIVKQYREKGLWIDVFRPPVIVGELISGKTFKFQGFYQLLHICGLEIFETLPGKGILMNIVPVDALCESIITIDSNSTKRNKNYHPFESKSVLLEQILTLYSGLKKVKKPTLVTPEEFRKTTVTPVQMNILRVNIFSFAAYVVLDSKKTNKELKQMGFEFSRVTKESLIGLMKFFGNRRSGGGNRL